MQYSDSYSPSVVKDIKELNKQINTTENSEEILKLRLKRLNKALEMSSPIFGKPYRAMFPWN